MALRFGFPPDTAPRRVVVTGAGVVTSHGMGFEENAAAFRSGRRSLRPVTLFDTSRQRVAFAGQVDLPGDLPPQRLSPRERSRMERGARLLLHAAHEALEQAGFGDAERRDLPLLLGTSAGAMALGEAYLRHTRACPGSSRGQTTRAVHYQFQNQAGLVCRAFGLDGPVTILSNACASGANAIGHAFSLVRSGRAERALCGGYDALCQLVFAGFDTLKALSTTSPRPFEANRDGLALGEGAAVLALETRDAALARGAEILGEITGYGAATDLHHLTQPQPAGDAALESMNQACGMAGVAPEEIGYLNSHGTGTPLNDSAEGEAIRRWAGGSVSRLPVSSTKGGIGHLLGGAGAVEAAVCLMALRGGFLPPNVPVDQPDPVCFFDLVQTPRDAPLRRALTNSFGFGGANATLILERAEA